MPSSERPLCIVIDNFLPVLEHDGSETTNVTSGLQLRQLLRGFAAKEPRVVYVEKPDGPVLVLGIGGVFAGVFAYPYRNTPPGERPSWMAQAKQRYATESRVFLSEEEPLEFDPPSLMPVEEAIEIVVSTMERGELTDTYDWVGAYGHRYRQGEPYRPWWQRMPGSEGGGRSQP